MTSQDAELLKDLTKVLWGSKIWRVRLNVQHSFEQGASESEIYSPEDLDELCLDFHKPLLVPERIRKHQRIGSVWINVANCGVRVQYSGTMLVSSGDSAAKLTAMFPKLIGSSLVEVKVDHPGGDTSFLFENDRTITCFPASSRGGLNWVIVTEDGSEIRLGPGIRVQYEGRLS